MLVMHQNSS